MLRRLLLATAHLFLLTPLFYPVIAQESQPRNFKSAPSSRPVEFSGLITSRLSLRELERWKAIERLVFVEDANRQPLHPTLRNMWEWVETSGHVVFIEISRSMKTASCTAGSFVIERFDPKGERHIAVIKLNLSNIDLAYVGPDTARENGFIPFEGLSKEERYVEVLGHELAHTIHILTSLERTKKVEEMVEQTNEMLLARRPYRKEISLSPEMKRLLTRRDALLKDLEKQAEEMEYIVWRELMASKSVREKMSSSLTRR
jgi:hypothetical protein